MGSQEEGRGVRCNVVNDEIENPFLEREVNLERN